MLETLAMILAGYAGYADWPWWWAALLGAGAGLWNSLVRLRLSMYADRPKLRRKTMYALAPSVMAVSALLFTGIYFVVRWIVS